MAGRTPWGSACSGFFAFSNPWWSSFGIGLLGTENMQLLSGSNTVGFFFPGRIYAAPFTVYFWAAGAATYKLPAGKPCKTHVESSLSTSIQPSFTPTGRRA